MDTPASLTADVRRDLLSVARSAIAAALDGRAYSPPDGPPSSARAGAFVTLLARGELRGCIGQIEAREPLRQVVARCAVSAATRDPRFAPLSRGDLHEHVEIEISVLTPLQIVRVIEEIEVGRDGLYIVRGRTSGLLLPQVAAEWQWDRETFLAHTCRKAGLPADAWKRGAEIFRFQADVFSEAQYRA